MKEFTFGETKYYESSDFFNKDYPLEDLEKHVEATTRLFIRRKLFRELLSNYGHKYNLNGYILLHAHGNKNGQNWMYADGKKNILFKIL